MSLGLTVLGFSGASPLRGACPAYLREPARQAFGGPVEPATGGLTYELPS